MTVKEVMTCMVRGDDNDSSSYRAMLGYGRIVATITTTEDDDDDDRNHGKVGNCDDNDDDDDSVADDDDEGDNEVDAGEEAAVFLH